MNKSYEEILQQKPEVYKEYKRKLMEGYYKKLPPQYSPSNCVSIANNLRKNAMKQSKKNKQYFIKRKITMEEE